MDLKVGHVCDRGLNPKRPVNQDRFLSIPARGLFAVFDGVGGQRAGEVASQTAADTIEETIAHHSPDVSPKELVRHAIEFANRDVLELAESDPAYKTMATTVALIHIEGLDVVVAHVGDSRVYRLEDGRFRRETVDHTDLNDDLRAGRIPLEQAVVLGSRNVINRALGVERGVEVEIKSIRVNDGARFLLCSDGIYRHLSDEEIARVLSEHKEPQRAADELKRIVLQRGADDNLTAVVVQVGRARQSPIIAIDDGLPRKNSTGARAAASAQQPDGKGRIEVEFTKRRFENEEPSAGSEEQTRSGRGSRIVMYVLLVLVLIAGAFYGGLRTSDYLKSRAPNSNAAISSFQTGRDAFDRGDYKMAASEFEALSKREPANASAFYWLGRALSEQHDYAGAAKNFEEAITRQPSTYDAYIQQAAAYELMGEKQKAAAALARYVEERRKQNAER
jgi:protein phosphatase